jgi:DNA-binding NarL/FixJ family response regulator
MDKILVVDDHVLFREGLISLLDAQPDFCVVGEAGSVREAIAKAHELAPDIILMDFSMPDGNGAEAAETILAVRPDIKIVFLTIHESDEVLFASIRSGAKGYLLKNLTASMLLESLRGMARGEAPISRTMTTRILDEFSRGKASYQKLDSTLQQLTPREMEVLKDIATGATNSEIASHLFISINTVKNHIHNILEKLKLKDRRELAAFARQHGVKGFPGTDS